MFLQFYNVALKKRLLSGAVLAGKKYVVVNNGKGLAHAIHSSLPARVSRFNLDHYF